VACASGVGLFDACRAAAWMMSARHFLFLELRAVGRRCRPRSPPTNCDFCCCVLAPIRTAKQNFAQAFCVAPGPDPLVSLWTTRTSGGQHGGDLSIAWSHWRAHLSAGRERSDARSSASMTGGRYIPFHEGPWLGRRGLAARTADDGRTFARGRLVLRPFGHPYARADEGLSLAPGRIRRAAPPNGPPAHKRYAPAQGYAPTPTGRWSRTPPRQHWSPADSIPTRRSRGHPHGSGRWRGCHARRLSVEIRARRPCARLRLPSEFRATAAARVPFRIEPAASAFGLTLPTRRAWLVEASRFPVSRPREVAQGRCEWSLRWLPCNTEDTEEIVQLCGQSTARSASSRGPSGWRGRSPSSSQLPSLLLWMSNRGAANTLPGTDRNRFLGVDPIASAFELGTPASVAPTPISAAEALQPRCADQPRRLTVGFRAAGKGSWRANSCAFTTPR